MRRIIMIALSVTLGIALTACSGSTTHAAKTTVSRPTATAPRKVPPPKNIGAYTCTDGHVAVPHPTNYIGLSQVTFRTINGSATANGRTDFTISFPLLANNEYSCNLTVAPISPDGARTFTDTLPVYKVGGVQKGYCINPDGDMHCYSDLLGDEYDVHTAPVTPETAQPSTGNCYNAPITLSGQKAMRCDGPDGSTVIALVHHGIVYRLVARGRFASQFLHSIKFPS